MSATRNLVGLDCGNTSYRVVLARFDGERIESETVFRRENRMVRVGDLYYWDILSIFDGLREGMAEAVRRAGRVDSVGVCTWGIDFALYDAAGHMLANPLSYRNDIGARELEALPPERRRALFDRTGILCDRINSLYMLLALRRLRPDMVAAARRVLMVPDIINHFLCGVMANEPTELSTTQLMDSASMRIRRDVAEEFGIDAALFGPIPRHGEALGELSPHLRDALGLAGKIPVVCVPSHDTASAVLAVPAAGESFAFVSSGTWALVGTELDKPVVDDAAFAAGLTNEVGAFGSVTLLRNHAGMFILERLRREYEAAKGGAVGWDEVLGMAAAYDGDPGLFDLNHADLFNPTDMAAALSRLLGRAGDGPDWPRLFASFHRSMAASLAGVVADLQRVSGRTMETVHVVGGGARNGWLNQLVANETGKPVVAGSPESAALGAVLAQLRHFDASLAVPDLRAIAAASLSPKRYIPKA